MKTESEIRVRPAYPFDAERILAWRAEESVRRYQPVESHGANAIRRDFSFGLEDLSRGQGTRFGWIIDAPRPVGWMTLSILSWEHGLAEIGYALTQGAQGQGIMQIALAKVLETIFDRSSLQRIEARCDLRNLGSMRVLESNQFLREGTLRDYFVLDGRRRDNALFALLRSEWKRPSSE